MKAATVIIALSLCALTTPVHSMQSNSKQATSTETRTTDSEKRDAGDDAKICKSFKVTGSRAKKERLCKTREEWIAFYSETRDEAGRLANREGVCSDASICGGN